MNVRTTRAITVSAVVAALAVLGLAGWSLVRSGPTDVDPTPSASTRTTAELHASPTPSQTPPTPLPAPTLTPIPDGTAVASGSVTSPKGSVHYTYRVVANGSGAFRVEFSGFTSTLPVPISVALAGAEPRISVGDGLGTNRYADTQLGGPTTAPVTLSSPLIDGPDPTFLTTLVTYSSATSTDVPVEIGPQKVLAVSPVTWSLPVRESNVHPVDGGERYWAYGVVTANRADGAPATYLVAHGDRASVVAQRFGISLQDLLWLNPSVDTFGGGKKYLYEGTRINLDPNALHG